MMYFVLQNVMAFRVDWQHLASPAYKLLLIASAQALASLPNEQYQYFYKIIAVQNFSVDIIVEVIRKILLEEDISVKSCRIVTNDEYANEVAAHTRQILGIDGEYIHIIKKFRNKITMKETLRNSCVRIPRYIRFDNNQYKKQADIYIDNIKKELGYPLFVKPVDAAGSEFAQKIDNDCAFRDWCEKNQDSDRFEIDEFISGTFYNTDALIENKEIIFTRSCKHIYPNYEFMLGKPIGSVVLREGSHEDNLLSAFLRQVLADMGEIPANSAINLDCYITEAGEPVFIEIAARAQGGMASQLYERHVGIHIEEAHFLLQMGL